MFRESGEKVLERLEKKGPLPIKYNGIILRPDGKVKVELLHSFANYVLIRKKIYSLIKVRHGTRIAKGFV
jgi:hypothetical protein